MTGATAFSVAAIVTRDLAVIRYGTLLGFACTMLSAAAFALEGAWVLAGLYLAVAAGFGGLWYVMHRRRGGGQGPRRPMLTRAGARIVMAAWAAGRAA